MTVDRRKSLQELEGEDWGKPEYDSYLVTTCHRLRQKPLEQFTIEDLRIMIGQGIGLEFLLPMAMEQLEREPLAEGDYYRGDLLKSVLTVELGAWQQYPQLRQVVEDVAKRALGMIAALDPADGRVAQEELHSAFAKFNQQKKAA